MPAPIIGTPCVEQVAVGEERERRLVDDREHVLVLHQVLGRGEVAAPDDRRPWSTYVILRPFTPPLAFCALMRASKPLMPFFEIDAADAGLRRDVAELDLLGGDAGIGRRHRRPADRGQTDRRQRGDDAQADSPRAPFVFAWSSLSFPP